MYMCIEIYVVVELLWLFRDMYFDELQIAIIMLTSISQRFILQFSFMARSLGVSFIRVLSLGMSFASVQPL